MGNGSDYHLTEQIKIKALSHSTSFLFYFFSTLDRHAYVCDLPIAHSTLISTFLSAMPFLHPTSNVGI